jgi:hypothetical protein
VTDVKLILIFSLLIINGRLAMVSTCSDLKEEELWVVLTFFSNETKNEQCLLVLLIKVNCSSAIGLQEVLMKLVAKTIQLFSIGIKKETLDLLSHLMSCHQMKTSFSQFMTFTFVFGKLESK